MHLDIRVVAEGGNDLHKKFISNVVNYGRAIVKLTGVDLYDNYIYIERDKPFTGNILVEQEVNMTDLLLGYEYTTEKNGVRVLAQDCEAKGTKFKVRDNTSFRPVRYCLEEKQADGSYVYQEFIYNTTKRKEDITLGYLNDFTSLLQGKTLSVYLGSTQDAKYLKAIVGNQIRLAGYDRSLEVLGTSVTKDKEEYNHHMANLDCDLNNLAERLQDEGYYMFETHFNRTSYLLVVKDTFYGLIKLRTTAQ